MKISYLNGTRFYNAFLAGAAAVIQEQAELNRINVFPVPDGDTGSNLAATLRSVFAESAPDAGLNITAASIADAALTGARGNSGLILAQYLYGFSKEVENLRSVPASTIGDVLLRAVRYTREAVSDPVEGTILTVIREWAESVASLQKDLKDYTELMPASLERAHRSLEETTSKLDVLARAGVVDAGAKGFVTLLEGIVEFLHSGSLRDVPSEFAGEVHIHHEAAFLPETVEYRYCTEAVISGENLDLTGIRGRLESYGDSVIVSGHSAKVHMHVHTSTPAELFNELDQLGRFQRPKADDMVRQVEAVWRPKSSIALVTDSACDLPQSILDHHQIHMVPLHLAFGESVYLDKVTMRPDTFYSKLSLTQERPTTSQPPTGDFEKLFSFLGAHYDSIVAVHLSSRLSGLWNAARLAAGKLPEVRISVIDSRNLCASLGLIVLEAAEAIERGADHEEVVRITEEAVDRAHIYVGVRTLKYMVRGGRISPVLGLVGTLMNLKPIVTLDESGKGGTFGRSYSQRGTLNRIRDRITQIRDSEGISRYAVVHAHAGEKATLWKEDFRQIIGGDPEYLMDISPVIGLHAGIGAVAISLLSGGKQ